MSIGNNISLIRKSKKLTQADLAKEIGISRSYLSDLENDRKNPSAKTLKNLAEKLNVPLIYLLQDETSSSEENIFNDIYIPSLEEHSDQIINLGEILSKQQDNDLYEDNFYTYFTKNISPFLSETSNYIKSIDEFVNLDLSRLEESDIQLIALLKKQIDDKLDNLLTVLESKEALKNELHEPK